MFEVIIAFVCVSVLGFLWFHPMFFGNLWRKYAHPTTSDHSLPLALTMLSQFAVVVLLNILMK